MARSESPGLFVSDSDYAPSRDGSHDDRSDTSSDAPAPEKSSKKYQNEARKVPLGTRARLATETAQCAQQPSTSADDFAPGPSNAPFSNNVAQNVRTASPMAQEARQIAMALGVNQQQAANQQQTEADQPKGFAIAGGEVHIVTLSKVAYEWVIPEVDFRKASTVFAQLLDNNKPILRTKAQRDAGSTIKWHFHLVAHKEYPRELRLRSFKFVPEKAKGKMQLSDIEQNLPDNPDFNRNYDKFFRIIANTAQGFSPVAPRLMDDSSIRDKDMAFIAQTLGVLIVAEDCDAMGAVAQFLETQYLRMGNRLWANIQRRASVWLNISVRIQSPIMFREAMIHIVGQITARESDVRCSTFDGKGEVFGRIKNLIAKKVKQMEELKVQTEHELLMFYPMEMYHPHTGNAYVPDRTVYSAEIYLYQARSIFQQYISTSFHGNLHHTADDGGTRLYRTINKGGDAYLTPASLGNWTERFASSARALSLLHQAIEKVKEEAKGYMKELMRDNTQGQQNENGRFGYLTCTWVEDDELLF